MTLQQLSEGPRALAKLWHSERLSVWLVLLLVSLAALPQAVRAVVTMASGVECHPGPER